MKPDISQFDQLPDEALVPASVLAAVSHQGLSTVWRRAKLEPDFPKLKKYGPKCTRATVGEIRRWMQGGAGK